MRYVAAYCLFALSGKTPSIKDLEKLLGSVGVDCDAEKAKKVVSELEGKDLEELFKEGEQLCSLWFVLMSSCGIILFTLIQCVLLLF